MFLSHVLPVCYILFYAATILQNCLCGLPTCTTNYYYIPQSWRLSQNCTYHEKFPPQLINNNPASLSPLLAQHLSRHAGVKQPKSLGFSGLPFSSNNNNLGTFEDDENSEMLCKRVVTSDGRYITSITCYERGQEQPMEQSKSLRMPTFGSQGGNALASLFQSNRRQLDLGRKLFHQQEL